MKTILALAVLLLAGCATGPMSRADRLAASHRTCRVEADVRPVHAISTLAGSSATLAYRECMRKHGFRGQ